MLRLRPRPLLFALAAVLAGGLLPGCDTDDVEAGERPDEGFVEVNGATIYYQAEGDAEDPVMVLVHGYPLDHGLFREQLDGLSDDYRVIAVDLRGYGQSTAPDDDATIETYADDVLDVMTELGVEQAVIGGMSMGGPIVLSMYDMAPDRFRGMLLIDTIAAAANEIEQGTWMGTVDFLQANGVEPLPPLLIDEMLTGPTRMENPELADYLIGLMREASLDAALAGARALAGRPDFQPLLDDIDVPVLVLVGVQDSIYPFEISQRMADTIGDNATLEILDGANHAAIIEVADAANAAIRDWAGDIDG